MKKLKRVVLIAIIVGTISSIIFIVNSWKIALYTEEFKNPIVICGGLDIEDKEYRVVMNDDKENSKVGYFSKNSWGFWELAILEDSISKDTGMLNLAWTGRNNIRSFEPQAPQTIEFEWHTLYCGNNAIRKIDNLEEKLPSNTTMGILQGHSFYIIHLITFSEEGKVLSEKEFYQLLKEAECVN